MFPNDLDESSSLGLTDERTVREHNGNGSMSELAQETFVKGNSFEIQKKTL